jgi:hypothetical protein
MINTKKNIAFKLFRSWTINASKDFPDNDFIIIDETYLAKDLEQSIKLAIECLIKEDNAERRGTKGFDYGYILGFIQGNLNAHWNNEYILKRSDDYKGFIVNKAILEYLKIDDIMGIRLNALYERFIKEDLNLQSYDFKINTKEIRKYDLDKFPSGFDKKNKTYVQTYLNNMIKKQIVELIDTFNGLYLPDLEQYIDEEYITELIKIHEETQ